MSQHEQTVSGAAAGGASEPEARSPAECLDRAARAIDAGQLPEAEQWVREVLAAQPNHASALHLLGLIAHHAGRDELAVSLIEKAIAVMPAVAQFHRNLGEIQRLRAEPDAAVRHGEQAVALAPDDAIAHSNLGIAYYDQREYERAAACQTRALRLDPNLAQALNNRGSIHRQNKDREAAIAAYREALAAAPEYVEARSNLAAVLLEMDRAEEALRELQTTVAVRPDHVEAHCNIGNAWLHLEQYDRARAAFSHARTLAPETPTALLGLARLAHETERLAEASALVNRALELAPADAGALTLAGHVHAKAEEYTSAREAYEKALEVEPEAAGIHLGIGQLWLELGQQSRAEAAFGRAIEHAPDELAPYVAMARARTVRPDDPVLARLEAHAADLDDLPPVRAMSLHFALGKAYEDLGRYDEAFPHFQAGCRLKRARITHDAEAHEQACGNIRSFFSAERIEAWSGAGDPSETPIFVLGMPRSGTTLVETIIASHPDVFAAGERHELLTLAGQPEPNAPGRGFPLSMQSMTRDGLNRLGARYVDALRARAPGDVRRITDKMPANFMALGLIHVMLPRARIIHVQRSAADVCVSNFTKLFNRGQTHSYDLSEMGRYYAAYAELMAHWRAVLPQDAFLDVSYERLTEDPDTQIRRLIDFCGLPWHEACLTPHKTDRSVRTASVTQVREPVYRDSIGRWRHYESFLSPLFEALGPYAPEGG